MKSNRPKYGLLDIEIQNFRGIRHARIENIPPSTPWIFLTGRNGYGKTCVLQAIYIGLFGSYTDDGMVIESSEYDIEVDFSPRGNRKKPREVSHLSQTEMSEFIRGDFPVIAYGPSRLSIQGSKNEQKDKSSRFYSLFKPDGVLLNIELELKNWNYRSYHNEIQPGTAEHLRNQLQGVTTILLELLPNLSEIKIDPETDEVKYFENDEEGNQLTEARSFDELASGNKSIIAMVGDMIIRLLKRNPGVSNPSDLEGVVIIDELDLHLHPNWQKQLPSTLSKIFPKIQFIASTHSAIPILGAPEGSIFLTVNRNKEDGITVEKLDIEISDLTPNLILSSPIFGFKEIFPTTHDSSKRIRTEDSMSELVRNDELVEDLKSFLGKEKESELLEFFKKK